MKPLKIAAWILLLALVACGASARQKTIATTLTAVNAGAAGFVAFDAKYQQSVIDHAPSKAVGEAQLADWRTKQLVVETGLASAYRAIAIAATLDDDQSLNAMLQAAAIVAQELQQVGVTP